MLTRAGKRQFDEIRHLPAHMITPPRKNLLHRGLGLSKDSSNLPKGRSNAAREPEHLRRPLDSEGSRIYYSDDDQSANDGELNSSMRDDMKTPSSENERLNRPELWANPLSRRVREGALKTKALIAKESDLKRSGGKISTARFKSKHTQGLKRTGPSSKAIPRQDPSRVYSASRPKSYNSKYVASVRGSYNSYPESVKLTVIDYAHNHSALEAAQKWDIPVKNIKRWMKNGPERKKGGRKTQDPVMESNLADWIRQYISSHKAMPSSRMIKDRALELSKFNDFKASKGWLEKFMNRNSFSEPRKHRSEPNSTFLDVETLTPIFNARQKSPAGSNQGPYSPGT